MPLPVLAAPALLAGVGAGGTAIAISGAASLNIAAAIAAGKAVGNLSQMAALNAIKGAIEDIQTEMEAINAKLGEGEDTITSALVRLESRMRIPDGEDYKSISQIIADMPGDVQAIQIKLVYPNDERNFYYELNTPEV